MLQVQGRSDIFLILEIVKKIISIGPICLGIFVSVYCMLIGSIIAGVINFFLNSYYTGRNLGYSSWMQIKDVAPSYGIAITMAISVFYLKNLPVSNWIILPLQIIVGYLVFYFICKLFKIKEYKQLKGILLSYIMKFKRNHNE